MPVMWLELAIHMVGEGLVINKMDLLGVPGKVLLGEIDVSLNWIPREVLGLWTELF